MKTHLVLLLSLAATMAVHGADPARVLIVVGPSSHPPGSHEVAAGGRLMQHCLEHMENVTDVKADVVYEWPAKPMRDAASTVVFIGDQFPPNRLPNAQQNLADLDDMMKRGCGLVCVHYATGLRAEDVAENGEHPLLHWMGGYFATRCKHHQSIAKIYPAAVITSAAAQHPVSRGWKEFTLHDEPYINNYFGADENKLAPNVTVLATSMLPPEDPKREAVAWGVERTDGGRGFGIVMPHFYKNWRHDDLRRLILNAIVWTAKREVPAEGVRTQAPDLAAFEPAAVEYAPPRPKKPAGADDALSEVNAERTRRGLRPFLSDRLLNEAARTCAQIRATKQIKGHLDSDFEFLPTGASAAAAGCGALDPTWGWATCCTYDNYTYAGAAWVMGTDGKRYMHIFVR